MRNPGWNQANLLHNDEQFRKRYSREGWVMIDALDPTRAVGVDTTSEGGADGYHYVPEPYYHMIAFIFYNLVCNGEAYTLDDLASRERWFHVRNQTNSCPNQKSNTIAERTENLEAQLMHTLLTHLKVL